jgi:hypothetical protein
LLQKSLIMLLQNRYAALNRIPILASLIRGIASLAKLPQEMTF